MNEAVVKVLKENIWYLVTFDQEPNAVPIAFKEITEDGKLAAADVFMETTVANVKATGKASVTVCDLNTKESYQVKGSAEYVTEGPVMDAFKKAVETKFSGARTCRGVVIITPERTVVATTGPDNNKEI